MNLNEGNIFYLIPKEVLDNLLQAVNDLKEMQNNTEKGSSAGAIGDYVQEERAMEILKRSKTWFWAKRKSGELKGKKAANRWYYDLDDLKNFIQDGRSI